MYRELFRIPGLDFAVYSYGLLLVIGTLAAIWLAKLLARRRGINPEIFVNAGLLAILSGVVGARIAHVLQNWGAYADEGFVQFLVKAANIREGGLVYYGGFLLAFPVLVLYARKVKLPIRVGMDIIAPCLMVGLAFGRIGCFLNGCCYGQMWDGACAVEFPYYSDAYIDQVHSGQISPPPELFLPDAEGQLRLIPPDIAQRDPALAELVAHEHALPVHATQIYSAITGFLIAAFLLAYMPFSRAPGRVFAVMLMVEPTTRFLLEAIRVEPIVFGGMSLSMLLALPQFLLGLLLWWAMGLYARSHPHADPATMAGA